MAAYTDAIALLSGASVDEAVPGWRASGDQRLVAVSEGAEVCCAVCAAAFKAIIILGSVPAVFATDSGATLKRARG